MYNRALPHLPHPDCTIGLFFSCVYLCRGLCLLLLFLCHCTWWFYVIIPKMIIICIIHYRRDVILLCNVKRIKLIKYLDVFCYYLMPGPEVNFLQIQHNNHSTDLPAQYLLLYQNEKIRFNFKQSFLGLKNYSFINH